MVIENAIEGIFTAQDGFVKFSNPNVPKIIGFRMEEILSRPFSKVRNNQLRKLTPQEFQIANLIRQGRTSKEIADVLSLS
jgi:DNA-binding NarL/FixJ family response regulator